MKCLKVLLIITLVGVISLMMVVSTALAQEQAKEPYFFVLNASGGAENAFWLTVRKGFEDACEQLGMRGLYLNPTEETDMAETLFNLESAIAKNPDGIIVCLIDSTMFDEAVKKAIDKGILVIAAGVDDSEGAEGNARSAYIGSDIVESGYLLAKKSVGYLPKPKPLSELKVLIGCEVPGAAWAEQRKKGMMRFFDEVGVKYELLDIGLDRAEQQSRTVAYLKRHPDVDIIVTTGNGIPGCALAVAALYKEGEKVLGGYDLIPEIMRGIEEGWISLTVDQQQYMWGYLPVLAMYWKLEYDIGPLDINTGITAVDASNVARIKELQKRLYR